MTIVVGYKDTNGKVWIGSDLSTLYGWNRLELNRPKFVNMGGLAVVGYCGLAMTGQYLMKLGCDITPDKWEKNFDFTSERGIVHFAEYIRDQLEEEGYVTTDEPGQPSAIEGSFIVATPDSLWLVSPDFHVAEIPDFTAIGSGAEFAYGSYYTANMLQPVNAPIPAKTMIQMAISAANKYNAGCSGYSEVICVGETQKEPKSAVRNSGQGGKRQGRTRTNPKKPAPKKRA